MGASIKGYEPRKHGNQVVFGIKIKAINDIPERSIVHPFSEANLPVGGDVLRPYESGNDREFCTGDHKEVHACNKVA